VAVPPGTYLAEPSAIHVQLATYRSRCGDCGLFSFKGERLLPLDIAPSHVI
jgi:hypothetical protein